MRAIDKIIFNELASRRAVVLPGLGTLGVVRRPARITGREVSPPENQVVYSKEEAQDAPSVIMLMEAMGASRDAAGAAYAEWLGEVRACDEISINGVGYVKDNAFVPSAELAQMLNPARQRPAGDNAPAAGGEPRPSRGSCPLRNNCLVNILLGAAIVMILIAGCIFFLHRGGDCRETRQIAGITPLHTVVGEERAAAVMPQPQPAAIETARGQYHLIAGSFAYESNADELIRELSQRHPDLTVEKITTPRWIMVSVFRGVGSGEAAAANRRLSGVLNNYEMWVYRAAE